MNRSIFYISFESFDFCIKNQIISFCFSFYITYIFNCLDIKIFEYFSYIYKILIKRKSYCRTS